MVRSTTDPWLSQQLGRTALAIALDGGEICERATLEELVAAVPAPVFAFVKIPSGDVDATLPFERAGFYFVETSLTFEKPLSGHRPSGPNPSIRLARPGDRSEIRAVARRSFRFSRFHVDPAIPNELADELKATWAENYFTGRRGDAMVVAEVDVGCVAFLQLIRLSEATLLVDLVAVDPDHQGRALGKAMLDWAAENFDGTELIRVTTQASNVPSVRLYEGLGFRLAASMLVFHCHRPGVRPG